MKKLFQSDDTCNYDDYQSGGIVKEIFIPIKQKFKNYKESFYNLFTENIIGKSINMKNVKRNFIMFV